MKYVKLFENIFYFKKSERGVFKKVDAKDSQNGESIFEINSSDNTFTLSKDPNVLKNILSNISYYLTNDVVESTNEPNGNIKSIKVNKPGKLMHNKLYGWSISEKMNITYLYEGDGVKYAEMTKYKIEFKIVYPNSINKNNIETDSITILVNANSEDEAITKLKNHILSKIDVVINKITK